MDKYCLIFLLDTLNPGGGVFCLIMKQHGPMLYHTSRITIGGATRVNYSTKIFLKIRITNCGGDESQLFHTDIFVLGFMYLLMVFFF